MPYDPSGKQNPACKAVLVGLANHAAPDGTAAFPAVRTLVRYTDLSERTVRTGLDRLAAEGIIWPCDPAIVAAKIKRGRSTAAGLGPRHALLEAAWGESAALLGDQWPGFDPAHPLGN